MSPILEAHGLTAAYRSWLACDCHPLFPLFHQYSPFSLTSISFPPWFCSSQLVKYISSPNNQMMLFVFNFILHFCLNCLNFKKMMNLCINWTGSCACLSQLRFPHNKKNSQVLPSLCIRHQRAFIASALKKKKQFL